MIRSNAKRNGAGKNGEAREAPVFRCALYTRKSTSMGLEQEFNSLDAQRESCEAYVRSQAANGWVVLEDRYDDGGFTGANVERPAFQRLLADAEAGKIDIVVVYKVDRLSRSLVDFAQVMDRFSRAKVAFVSVTQNFSTTDSIGKLTLNLLMSFAEFEREMISERTRDKIAASRRRGKWTGGTVPLGYEVRDHKLLINPVEAPLVGEIFLMYGEQRSALKVAQALNASGTCTKRHRAANGNLREARAWTKQDVLRILRNPVYAGYMSAGDNLHESEHDGIVDRDLYHQTQALLDDRPATSKDVQRNPAFFLRGILRCGVCGAAMTTASNRRNGRIYRYYRCVTRDKEGAGACCTRPLPAEEMERFVVDRIREVIPRQGLAGQVAHEMDCKLLARRGELEKVRRGLPDEIRRGRLEVSSLAEKIAGAEGQVQALLEARLAEANAALGRSEGLLAQVDRDIGLLAQTEVDTKWVARALGNFDKVWDLMTPENKTRLVRALVRSVRVDGASDSVSIEMAGVGREPGERAEEEAR
jgi:DNA invertase Pin-like site-specific DNA recombinase